MAVGTIGRRILGSAAKRRKGVKVDIEKKEVQLNKAENKLQKVIARRNKNRQAAKNLEKSTNTSKRVNAAKKVVEDNNLMKEIEAEIERLNAAIKGNVKRTYGAKQTPDWQRIAKSGEVESAGGLTKRKSSGQREHPVRKKGGQVKTTYRAGGGLVSESKTMHGYREGGQV